MTSSNGVKASDRPESAVCNVEDCNAWKSGDFDKCHHHKGVNDDGSSHENNQNARKHGYYVEPDAFYQGLSEDKQKLVDDIEKGLHERYKEYHGREPDRGDREDHYEVAIGYAKRRCLRDYQAAQAAESGNPLLELREKDGNQFKVPSSVEELITDSRRENRLERQTSGLENDPESQKAEANKDLASLWADDLTNE